MMHGRFNATSGDNLELGCKVLRVPFVGEKLEMVFLLPNAGSRLVWLSDKI
jgi:hypothetical protein